MSKWQPACGRITHCWPEAGFLDWAAEMKLQSALVAEGFNASPVALCSETPLGTVAHTWLTENLLPCPCCSSCWPYFSHYVLFLAITPKCSRGQEQPLRSGCWPQAKANKQSEGLVSLELDGGKTAGERRGWNDRYFNLKLFGTTSNGFLCCGFY